MEQPISKNKKIIMGAVFALALFEGFIYFSGVFLGVFGKIFTLAIFPVLLIILPLKNIISIVLIFKRKFIVTNIFGILITMSGWYFWAALAGILDFNFFVFRFIEHAAEIIQNILMKPAGGFLALILSLLLIYFYFKEYKEEEMF